MNILQEKFNTLNKYVAHCKTSNDMEYIYPDQSKIGICILEYGCYSRKSDIKYNLKLKATNKFKRDLESKRHSLNDIYEISIIMGFEIMISEIVIPKVCENGDIIFEGITTKIPHCEILTLYTDYAYCLYNLSKKADKFSSINWYHQIIEYKYFDDEKYMLDGYERTSYHRNYYRYNSGCYGRDRYELDLEPILDVIILDESKKITSSNIKFIDMNILYSNIVIMYSRCTILGEYGDFNAPTFAKMDTNIKKLIKFVIANMADDIIRRQKGLPPMFWINKLFSYNLSKLEKIRGNLIE